MKKNPTKAEVIKEVRVIVEKETQRQMATRLGVTQSELSCFESSTRIPTKRFMENFFKAHKINLLAYRDNIKVEKTQT